MSKYVRISKVLRTVGIYPLPCLHPEGYTILPLLTVVLLPRKKDNANHNFSPPIYRSIEDKRANAYVSNTNGQILVEPAKDYW